MAQVRFSPRAERRLDEIGDRIALDAPERAADFVLKLITATRRLGDFPESGALCPENETLRQIVLHGYRIVYRASSIGIEIATILAPGQSFNFEWQKFVESNLREWASDNNDGL